MQDYNTRHSIGAVHQRGRALQYLYRTNTVAVDLHTMFVTPLLSFLAHALAHHHHAVVAQSADDGLRDAAARRQLADTRLVGYGIDDIR